MFWDDVPGDAGSPMRTQVQTTTVSTTAPTELVDITSEVGSLTASSGVLCINCEDELYRHYTSRKYAVAGGVA